MMAHVLTINGGSSSLKFALFAVAEPPRRRLAGRIDRIGLDDAFLEVGRAAGGASGDRAERHPVECADHAQAIAALIEWLRSRGRLEAIGAVGHRVVHGGDRFTRPERLTAEVIEELRRLSPLDPAHLPGEIAMIEALARMRPELPQIACFDTAFHAALPRVARLLAIPRRYQEGGIRRYGFHGLSYQYLTEELERVAPAGEARERVILAHLGNGASLAALRGGACIETSMGFTPASGVPMGTRSGDLDPGVLVHLMRREGWTADQLDDLVNHRSGLLGVSGSSPDMRDLLERRASDAHAAEAVALFCYQVKKWIGAFAAALGGLDTLVFAGGIGERAAEVRAEACSGLEFLGIRLDERRNAAGAPVISADGSAAVVRVIATDEELVIARAVCRVLEQDAKSTPSSRE